MMIKMNRKILFLLLCLFNSSKSIGVLCDCNENKAIQTAMAKFRKKGYELDRYKMKVSEDTFFYKIKFILSDSIMEGGGADFKISKENCKILNQQFYQ